MTDERYAPPHRLTPLVQADLRNLSKLRSWLRKLIGEIQDYLTGGALNRIRSNPELDQASFNTELNQALFESQGTPDILMVCVEKAGRYAERFELRGDGGWPLSDYCPFPSVEISLGDPRVLKWLKQCLESCKRKTPVLPRATTAGTKQKLSDDYIDGLHGKVQRKFLGAVNGKGNVKIEDVLNAVYGTKSKENLEALLKAKDRLNSKLIEDGQRFELKKTGETLALSHL